jgi:hypothetical protein
LFCPNNETSKKYRKRSSSFQVDPNTYENLPSPLKGQELYFLKDHNLSVLEYYFPNYFDDIFPKNVDMKYESDYILPFTFKDYLEKYMESGCPYSFKNHIVTKKKHKHFFVLLFDCDYGM